MNVSEIALNDTFVTDVLPLEVALYCGVKVIGKETLPDGKTKLVFKRARNDETFFFFSDDKGEIQIGHWIPYPDLDVKLMQVKALKEAMEYEEQQIAVAKSNLRDIQAEINKVLE